MEASFEVEDILDYRRKRGVDEYLIKWEGYAVSESTWEPKQNLNCPQLLKDFHARNSATHVTSTEAKISLLFNLQDTLGGRIGQVERTSTNRIYLTFTNTSFKQKMVENRKRLAKWEKIINSASASQQRQISIVNDVDLMCFQFDYIIKCALSASVSPNVSYQDGCDGSVCCESGVNCCPSHGGYQFAYSLPDGSLISSIGNPIVECSNSCRCDPEKCVNRQVERGSKLNLEIFRTNDNRGWGVRTRAPVCRGTFIEEYVGEIVTLAEAEKRLDRKPRRHSYMIALAVTDAEPDYVLDSFKKGNVARFFNHSCDPNMEIRGVITNQSDSCMPRLAFFASQDIVEGAELTFDYQFIGLRTHMDDVDVGGDRQTSKRISNWRVPPTKKILCRCGTQKCRKMNF